MVFLYAWHEAYHMGALLMSEHAGQDTVTDENYGQFPKSNRVVNVTNLALSVFVLFGIIYGTFCYLRPPFPQPPLYLCILEESIVTGTLLS